MKKKILFLLLLLPIFLWANEYTLENIIEMGLGNSVDIISGQISCQNAKSDLRSSWYGVLPDFSASAGKSKTDDYDWTNSASLDISKGIFLNEPSFYSIKQAKVNKKNAELSLENSKKSLVYNILLKYIAVLEAKKLQEIQKKNLKLQQSIFQQVKTEYELGEKSSLEFKKSRVDLLDDEIKLYEAENQYEETRIDLFGFVNCEDESFPFADLEIVIDTTEIAYSRNLDLRISENEIKTSKLLLLQQKLDFLPSFSLYYSYGYTNTRNDILKAESYDDSQTLSLNASYSIFNLLDRNESYLQAKRNIKIAKLIHRKNLEDSRIQYRNQLKDYNLLLKTYKLYEKKFELSEENLKLAQKQFSLGNMSVLDFETIKLSNIQSEISYISKRYELISKRQELILLISGKILGKW